MSDRVDILRASVRASLIAAAEIPGIVTPQGEQLDQLVDFIARNAAQALVSGETWETPAWAARVAEQRARALGARPFPEKIETEKIELDPCVETSATQRRRLSAAEQAFVDRATERQSVAYRPAPRIVFEDLKRRYLNPPYFVDQAPRRVPHCGLCAKPAHASESNDWGHHPECQAIADAWADRVLAAMKAEPEEGAAAKLAVVMRREAVSDFEKTFVERVLGPRAAP